MNIAYRFRIYPNREQEVLLAKTFGCCRFLYNQMLNDKIREYKATKKMLRNTPAIQINISVSFINPEESLFASFYPYQLPVRIMERFFFVYIFK